MDRDFADSLRALGHDVPDRVWVCTEFPRCSCRSWLEADQCDPQAPSDCREGHPMTVDVDREFAGRAWR